MKKKRNFKSVNWHLLKRCNYNCVFCFSGFEEIESILSKQEALLVLEKLKEIGVEKITLTGGEPLLYPFLGDLLIKAKECNFTTMIVTNGSLITREFLDNYNEFIDWIGISIESNNEQIELKLGRGKGEHVENTKQIVKMIRGYGIKIKINCVINSLNYRENISNLIDELKPDRLKIFQVMEVEGENDQKVKPYLITEKQFKAFVKKHKMYSPIVEKNTIMRNSYLMLDPLGRFFQNSTGTLIFSKSILEISPLEAIREVGWSRRKFRRRGGFYDW